MKASRDYFFEEIGKVLEAKDIYIVSADLAGKPFDYIRENYPDRYVSVGIAEQNMISVACGIALCGSKVIAYTSNPFISFRAFDQVRNGAALMNLPIAIAGVGVGFGISEYGTTHFVTEDFAMMSLCPNMKIITISDNAVAEKAYHEFVNGSTLMYLRFDKLCGDEITIVTNEDYQHGFRYIRNGENILIISTGYLTHMAMEYSSSEAVIDLFSFPFDSDALLFEINKYRKVYVLEEQQIRGGLGSALLESFRTENIKADVVLKGINYEGKYPSVYGSREYWLRQYGLKQ